jgi:prephenate dehydrogenase
MPLFSRIVIIGVGLIGGSIGLAVKKRQLTGNVIGVDTNEERLHTAQQLEAVDQITTDLTKGINGGINGSVDADIDAGAELVIVATPVSLVHEHVWQVASAVQNGGINHRNVFITDVGSTKETICSRLDQKTLPNGCRFIGSHPLAGKEKSGVEHADADLFENRLVVITPTASAHDRDIGLLIQFWRSLGSLTASMSPAEHDRTLARTSHLPHLLSALLAERLQLQDVQYTGPGYHSTTRLASGQPELWRDIVSHNAEAILEAIRDYEGALRDLREKIERNDWEAVARFLEHAKRNRDMLMGCCVEHFRERL